MKNIPYRWALITGASSGIGEEFALQLAAKGRKLTLVARRRDALESVAKRCQALGADVDILVADLATHEGIESVAQYLQQNFVDLLINNAGFGFIGEFLSMEKKNISSMLDVNIYAVTQLSYAALSAFKARENRGGLMNVASVAGFFPMPYFSLYAATKAFVLRFTQGLAAEFSSMPGIRIAVVCPGPTKTAFFERAGNAQAGKQPFAMTAARCVEIALSRFTAGSEVIITGSMNSLMVTFAKFLPELFLLRAVARMMKNRSQR